MKGKFHTNKKGITNSCYADKEPCPFGGEDGTENHYDTFGQARKAYEKDNSVKTFVPLVRRKRAKFLAVGGVILTAISVTGCTDITTSHDFFDDEQVQQVQEKTVEYGQKTKDVVKEKGPEYGKVIKDKGSEYGKKLQEKIDKALDEKSDNYSSPQTGSNADPNEVYYQGRTLQPSAQDIKEARNNLKGIKIMPERSDYDYNREVSYGGFKSGVVGEMERRDVTNGVFESNSKSARAIGGYFIDPYTGDKVEIIKGSSNDTNVDHIVALHEVEKSIDRNKPLSDEQKVSIANDPDNLIIVGAAVNKSKSDKDAADWMPSYDPAICTYTVSVIKVKSNYELTMDSLEAQAIEDALNTKCY